MDRTYICNGVGAGMWVRGGLKLTLRDPNPRPQLPLWKKHIFFAVGLEVFNTLMNHYGQQKKTTS